MTRAFATEVIPQPSFNEATTTSVATTKSTSKPKPEWKLEGRTRPQPTKVTAVDPNHPLYAFFRQAAPSKEDAESGAPAQYVPFEPYWDPRFESGAFLTSLLS